MLLLYIYAMLYIKKVDRWFDLLNLVSQGGLISAPDGRQSSSFADEVWVSKESWERGYI